MESKNEQIIAYNSLEELSEAFDKVQNANFVYESTGTDQGTLSFKKSYEMLKRIEHSIIKEGMFSPNETIKEVHTENLK